MKLVVTIPAYNEEKTIARMVAEVPRAIEGVDQVEVLVIDDGSTDGTVQQAKEAGADRVVSHAGNMGVGAAFATGRDSALGMGADIIVTMDADGQFDPKDIPRLIEPVLEGQADFVTGSRFLDRRLKPKMSRIKRIGNNFFTRIVNSLTGQKLADTQCGFRAYSWEAAMRSNTFGDFTYTQEVLIDLLNKKMKVREVPVQVREREGESRVVTHWYSYGLKALVISIRTFRDHKPLKFFGSVSLLALIPGVMIGLFVLAYWVSTGRTSPFTSLLYLVVVLLVLGTIFIVLALIADMLGRLRGIEEELLYDSKRQRYKDGGRLPR